MQTTKLLSGWYRLSGDYHFSNIKREGREWLVDVRVRSSGDLAEMGGLWTRKSEAFEEAARLIERRDRGYIPTDDEAWLLGLERPFAEAA